MNSLFWRAERFALRPAECPASISPRKGLIDRASRAGGIRDLTNSLRRNLLVNRGIRCLPFAPSKDFADHTAEVAGGRPSAARL
jgi:hypothetical protein